MRIGLWAAVAVLSVLCSTASADPVVYKLVANIPGGPTASTMTGTVVFPMSSIGAAQLNSADLVSLGISVVGYAPAGPGWTEADLSKFGDLFFIEAIGDPILNPSTTDTGSWQFNNGTANASVPQTMTISSDGAHGWIWKSDGGVIQSATVGNFTWRLERVDVVPEPSTIVLFGAAGLAIVWVTRRARS